MRKYTRAPARSAAAGGLSAAYLEAADEDADEGEEYDEGLTASERARQSLARPRRDARDEVKIAQAHMTLASMYCAAGRAPPWQPTLLCAARQAALLQTCKAMLCIQHMRLSTRVNCRRRRSGGWRAPSGARRQAPRSRPSARAPPTTWTRWGPGSAAGRETP